MTTKRLVAETDTPSARSKMARARLTNPAATLVRRCNASSSCRCSADKETMQRPMRFAMGLSVFAKTQVQASKISGL
jgi:hypothetical protein